MRSREIIAALILLVGLGILVWSAWTMPVSTMPVSEETTIVPMTYTLPDRTVLTNADLPYTLPNGTVVTNARASEASTLTTPPNK